MAHHANPRAHLQEEEALPDLSSTDSRASTEADDDRDLEAQPVYDDKEDIHNDGHRPTLRDIRSHNSSSRSLSNGASGPRNGGGLSASATGLSRTQSHFGSVVSRIRSRPDPVFTHPMSHVKTSAADLVDFDGPDDPYHPLNWTLRRKGITTFIYATLTMSASWASSSYSSGTALVAEQFHVGSEVAILGTTLFLMGFGIGPLIWAPLSEVYGRRLAVMVPMFIGICFSFASAVSKDLQSLMITRFFGAFFCSAPVTNTGGVLGDLYTPAQRGMAMAGYAMAVVAGPALGPIVSAAVVQTPYLGWRWTEYITGILQSLVLIIAVIFIDESYPPKLLVYKARRLRHETGNWALHAKFEEWDVSIKELARKFLLRPLQLLATPICALVAIYASFCYGIIYMQLGALPIIFGEVRGWNGLESAIPFICIFIGSLLGAAVNVVNQIYYNKAYHAAGDRAVPEKRLPPMMLGSVLFSGGLFITGWTARADIPWIAPCIGITIVGMGFTTIFQAALNYLVDTFTMYAASAVAANTFLRSCLAAGFPLAVSPLYHNVGIGPGSSIMAGFATLLIPVPFVFYVYGKKIRARSKWSKPSVH